MSKRASRCLCFHYSSLLSLPLITNCLFFHSFLLYQLRPPWVPFPLSRAAVQPHSAQETFCQLNQVFRTWLNPERAIGLLSGKGLHRTARPSREGRCLPCACAAMKNAPGPDASQNGWLKRKSVPKHAYHEGACRSTPFPWSHPCRRCLPGFTEAMRADGASIPTLTTMSLAREFHPIPLPR